MVLKYGSEPLQYHNSTCLVSEVHGGIWTKDAELINERMV